MVLMLFHGGVVNHYVIQVDYHEFTEVLVEDLVHQCTECDKRISQTKGHDEEFEGPISSDRSRFGLISFSNPDLVVFNLRSSFEKYFTPCSRLNRLVMMGRGYLFRTVILSRVR